jgi:uncharacterized protein GlcG (DUF336 family)
MPSYPTLLLAALAAVVPASAQTVRPNVDIAREAATAAVVECQRMGFRIMATVVDGSGRPVAAMVADPELAQSLASDSVHTAQIAGYFHDRSSRIADRMMDEPSVYYALQDHPQLTPLKPGGVPFPGPETLVSIGVAGPHNNDGLSAIGVAGAPDGDKDEECGVDGVMDVLRELR